MPKWRYGKTIGSGGFGRVHRAVRVEDVLALRTPSFAIKFLLDENLDDEEAVARFEREVRLARDELRHPNVIGIVDSNVDASPPWFVMPRAQSNLRDEIDAGRGSVEEWVALVFRQILAGVAHAHAQGVLHRDLKPGNVLFVSGVPQIADFGLGKRLATASTTLTGSHTQLGTPAYMAPEQWSDSANVDARADVYALGKMLCEMFNGRVPAPGIRDTKGVPVKYRYFVERACSNDPSDRYPDAGAALTEFTKLTEALEVVQPPQDQAIALINDWESLPPDDDLSATRALDEHLRRHRDDGELLRAVIPKLPRAMVRQYMQELASGFEAVLRAFDDHLDGGLPFEYCDVVADFYRSIWDQTDDPVIRRLILARLVDMGPSHNRWHVGTVVRDLLVAAGDAGTASMAADVLRADPANALWFDGYFENAAIPKIVADTMANLRDPEPMPIQEDVDDFPF